MQTKATELLFLDTVTKQIMVAVQKCCILIQKLKITHICIEITCFWPNFGKIINKCCLFTIYGKAFIQFVSVLRSWQLLLSCIWTNESWCHYLTILEIIRKKKWLWSKRRFEKIIRHSKGRVTVSYRLTSFGLRVLKSFELVKQRVQSLCLLEHYSISISSSPQLRWAGRLNREECVSAGGLGGLWGAGDGHGVTDSEDAVCCFRCLWMESLCFRQKGSSGGRHNTSSMQEWLLEKKKTTTMTQKIKHGPFLKWCSTWNTPVTRWEGHTRTEQQCAAGCHWFHAGDLPSNCRRAPAPVAWGRTQRPNLHPHRRPPVLFWNIWRKMKLSYATVTNKGNFNLWPLKIFF